MTGCSVLVSLNGLTGGCDGACVDAAVDPAKTSSREPPDASSFADTGSNPTDDADGGGVTEDDPGDGALPGSTDGAPGAVPFPVDAGPCTPPTPASLDLCTGLGAMSTPPFIDGVLDCGIPLWSMPVVVSVGPGAIPTSVQASIGAAWRPDGLYLFVSVTGAGADRYPAPASDPAWCGDAIELFVDHDGVFTNPPKYNDPGTIQLVAAAPPDTSAPTSAGEMFRDETDLGPWTGQFVSTATSDGFTTEAFVTAADLGLTSWSLAAGGTVGLDVSVNLGSPTESANCPRLAQFTIQLPHGSQGGCGAACDVGEFCKPQLE